MVFGDNEYFQTEPQWRDLVPFFQYCHGDTGEVHTGAGDRESLAISWPQKSKWRPVLLPVRR